MQYNTHGLYFVKRNNEKDRFLFPWCHSLCQEHILSPSLEYSTYESLYSGRYSHSIPSYLSFSLSFFSFISLFSATCPRPFLLLSYFHLSSHPTSSHPISSPSCFHPCSSHFLFQVRLVCLFVYLFICLFIEL